MNAQTQTDRKLVENYLVKSLPLVMKQPRGTYRYPFIDPGSTAYEGNLWDWDSFWAIYSLINAAENGTMDLGPDFSDRVKEHAKGNVLNFLSFQLPDGYIPMMVNNPEEEVPYLIQKHKNGVILNMHKPFLCQQVCLASGFSGSYEWIKDKIPQLEQYLACYDKYYYHSRSKLYLWADDVMIGVDNDPATFGRPRFSTASVYLNSFLVREFQAMAQICRACVREDEAARYDAKAKALAAAINDECWDERDQIYYSVDADIQTRSYDWFHKGLGVFWNTLPIKVRCWSSFLPMFAGIATNEQAQKLVRHITDEKTFWSPSGVRSLSRDEKMYDCSATGNPSNWLGPIWIITQYAVFRGLMNYGYREQAQELCRRTLALLGNDLRQTNTLHEYYVPETGEPVCNAGFVNWNILALNMADELDGKPSAGRFLPAPISHT